jgi:hypothetical protein
MPNTYSSQSKSALDTRARRAARRIGLIAMRSRRRVGSVDNRGGFQLLDLSNRVVAGERCDMTQQQVIDYCTQ